MDNIKDIINNADSDDDSDDIELNNKVEKKPRKTRSDKIERPEKKPYVYTEARQKQMEIAREVKMKKVAIKKEEMNIVQNEYLKKKKELEDKKFMRMKKKQEKELLALQRDLDERGDDSSEEDEIIIMKKPKKKVIYVQSKEKKQVVKEPEYIKPVRHYAYF